MGAIQIGHHGADGRQSQKIGNIVIVLVKACVSFKIRIEKLSVLPSELGYKPVKVITGVKKICNYGVGLQNIENTNTDFHRTHPLHSKAHWILPGKTPHQRAKLIPVLIPFRFPPSKGQVHGRVHAADSQGTFISSCPGRATCVYRVGS